MIGTIAFIVFPLAMVFAAFSDLFTMTIPNRVSAGLVVAFFALALWLPMPLDSVLWHIACGLTMLVLTFVFFSRGWIGGGDAKLAAATALWLGFEQLLPYLLYASLLGGVLTFALIQLRLMPLPAPFVGQPWAERLHRMDTGIPYGIALAAAALLIYPQTTWMTSLGM